MIKTGKPCPGGAILKAVETGPETDGGELAAIKQAPYWRDSRRPCGSPKLSASPSASQERWQKRRVVSRQSGLG